MSIYYFIVVVLLSECLVFNSSYRNKKSKKFFYQSTVLFLALVAGCRAMSVGHDTFNYSNIFYQISLLSLESMLGVNPYSGMEQGYVWLCWFFSKLSNNYSHFLIAVALFEFYAIGTWIWNNTKKPFIGLLIFTCMFYTFFLTGIRQCIATAIVLFAYDDIKNKDAIKFLMKVMMASLFHQSVLIAVVMYFLPIFFPDCKKTFVITVVAAPILFLTRRKLFSFVTGIFARYNDYEILSHGDAITYTLMLALIIILAVFMLRAVPLQSQVKEGEYCNYVNNVMIALLVMPFVGLNGSIMRVAMYFSINICLLIERIYGQFKNKKTRIAAVLVSVVALVFLFFNELMGSSYLYEFVGFDVLFSENGYLEW